MWRTELDVRPWGADRCGYPDGILVWISRGAFRQDGVWGAEQNCFVPVWSCAADAAERSLMKMSNVLSPCATCVRVMDPEECTDKSCRAWQMWFLHQWEESRAKFRQFKDQKKKSCGVPIGGHRYAMPHQVRAYLREDPCGQCQYPAVLCKSACRKRLIWADCMGEES